MKRKNVVAVIDTGVNEENLFQDKTDTRTFVLKNRQFIESDNHTHYNHGTSIVNKIIFEAPNVEIISIIVLNKDNKGEFDDLILAMEFCNKLNVDVINLSVGITNPSEKQLSILRNTCDLLKKNNIEIIAAASNDSSVISYPGAFNDVVSVESNHKILTNVLFDSTQRRVVFFEDNIHIINRNDYILERGNSFLVPIVVGLYVDYISHKSNYKSFDEFLNHNLVQYNMSKIFYEKSLVDNSSFFYNKKLYFFSDVIDETNIKLLESVQDVCNVDYTFGAALLESNVNFSKLFKKNDIFFIGAVSSDFMMNRNVDIKRLLKILLKGNVMVITLFPLLSVSERIKLSNKYDGHIESIYY